MKHLAFILLLTLLLPTPAAAGGVALGGPPPQVNVRGRVVDEDGDPLPGAKVSATNRRTGEQLGGVADDEGYFTLSDVRPGPYRVKIEFEGIIKEFDIDDLQGGPEAYSVPVGDKKPPKKPRSIRSTVAGETEIVSAPTDNTRSAVAAGSAQSGGGSGGRPGGNMAGQAVPGTRCSRIPVGSKKRKKGFFRRLF